MDDSKTYVIDRVLSHGMLTDWQLIKAYYGRMPSGEVALNQRYLDRPPCISALPISTNHSPISDATITHSRTRDTGIIEGADGGTRTCRAFSGRRYFAGLAMGHRKSIDLDLFTHQPFDAETTLETLRQTYQVQPLTVTNTICITVIDGIKVDFVHFRYPFAFPLIEKEGVRLADKRDIAPMKLDAVTKRGSKKDFYDMYYLFEEFAPQQILDWYG
ncbi:MAG: hypothetical protein IPN76_12920 [Saprospiraceae bacterium]|nr:hypothetical protein [Saprospiraceae bacterium]